MESWNIVGNHTGELVVTMEGEEWADALKAAKEHLIMRSNQVGTDPEQIEKSDIAKVAVNKNIEMLFQRGIVKFGLVPSSEPVVEMKKLNSEEAAVCFRFAVMPQIVIPDLSSLTYEVESVSVTACDIEKEVEELRKSLLAQGIKIPGGDDEMAKSFGIEGVSCMDDLKAAINDSLMSKRSEQAKVDAENKLMDEMITLFEFEAPDAMVDMEVDSTLIGIKDNAASHNVQFEDYLKDMKMSEEQLREELRPEAARNIKIRLILDKIAQENKLAPSKEEIEAEYTAMAEAYKVPIDDFKAVIPESDIIYQKSIAMALDFVKSK